MTVKKFEQILIIQTAFIGDVILATAIIEKIHQHYPRAKINFLLRKGNEALFVNHPFINKVIIWDKKASKYGNLIKIGQAIRRKKYDLLVNLQRFANTGLLTTFSNAKHTVGFDKNPFSFFFDESIPHEIGNGKHEVERNLRLISKITNNDFTPPKLYPSREDYKAVQEYKTAPYICIAPTSVWFTKQFPAEKWVEFINKVAFEGTIYLLGAPSDIAACEAIKATSKHPKVINLAGRLSLLESAALMQDALLNYVNDSAPLHLASAVNAKTCAIFCSTVPAFGFYPLADFSEIVEISTPLSCRPCGLHGYKACPLGHFNCAHKISVHQLLTVLEQATKPEGYSGNA